MIRYYVRKTGSDSNAGTGAGAAWLTIDKAANTVAAGDEVVVGAGVYRELVTMDTSGSSGNQISFIADVTGEYTGDAGLVIVTSYDREQDATTTRTYCWNLNGKTFVTVRGFVMQASASCIHDAQLAGDRCYDGVIIEDCALAGIDYGIDLDLNAGAAPSSAGLIIRRCKVSMILIRHDNNATANVNVNVVIENIEIHKYLSTRSGSSDMGIYLLGAATNTFSVGGITIANCTCYGGGSAVKITVAKNTTNPIKIVNLKSYAQSYPIQASSGTTAAVEAYATSSPLQSTGNNGVTNVDQYNDIQLLELFGGFGDFPFRKSFGWSPWEFGETISLAGYTSATLAYSQSGNHLPTEDLYANPRGLGRPGHWNKYYFDASDDAVTDPGNVWTSESNIFDATLTTNGNASTAGSSSSNYVHAGGTNAPSSGGTITGVYVRIRAQTSVSRTAGFNVYTDALGETLLSTTQALSATTTYYDWTALSVPSGGWTWAKIQALEFRAWVENSGSGSASLYVIQLAVSTDAGHSDLGAVEERNRPTKSSTVAHGGTYSARFAGAGVKSFWVPVAATSTTISCYARYDSNYSGNLPKMTVKNIPGVADQSDTMTGGANAWEQLACTFTPTSEGWVRVILQSQDVSTGGYCYFDDMA